MIEKTECDREQNQPEADRDQIVKKMTSGDAIAVGHDPSVAVGCGDKPEVLNAHAGKAIQVD